MIARIDEARSNGDTVGGVFEVVVHGAPIGLGSYVHWDRRLDAALAAAVMSINIVKGVEIGLGFEQTRRFGSQVHDVIEGRRDDGTWIHRSNNAGGLTGGVTNGEPIVVRGAVKPISTLARPLPTADLVTGEPVDKAHYERSDISVVPAAGVIGEAMVMLTLARFVLEKTGGDSMAEVEDNLRRVPRADRGRTRAAGGRRAAAGRRAGRRLRDDAPRTGTARPAPAGTTDRPMDLVLVGLPGSGKSAVGRRIASRHGATFVDLDDQIEHAAGRKIPEIFAADGEAGVPAPGARRGRRAGPARSRPGAAAGDLARRRRRRRPAQPLVALPRPRAGLARRPPGGPRPAAAPLAQRPAAGAGRRPGRPDPPAGGGAGAVLRGGQPGQRRRRAVGRHGGRRAAGRRGRAGGDDAPPRLDADRRADRSARASRPTP